MRFLTETGSAYEVDHEKGRIRRLSGNADPTVRQGKDGEWREYQDISDIRKGQNVLIVWPDATPLLVGSPTGAIPSTLTSPVTRIDES